MPPGQASQSAPPVPHTPLVCIAKRTQVVALLQQPIAQLVAVQLHTPDTQSCVPVHPAHAAPPVPHCVSICVANGTHVFPSQQPPAQLAALQTQSPPMQAWPTPHAAHVSPPDPQSAVVVPGL